MYLSSSVRRVENRDLYSTISILTILERILFVYYRMIYIYTYILAVLKYEFSRSERIHDPRRVPFELFAPSVPTYENFLYR